jgi:S-DNA-T family DNA segregation ATPase FtsK/SpoIIIE
MSRSARNRKRPTESRILGGVLLLTLALLLGTFLVIYLHGGNWRAAAPSPEVQRAAGRFGFRAARGLVAFGGVLLAFWVPLAAASLGVRLLRGRRLAREWSRALRLGGILALLVAVCTALAGGTESAGRQLLAGWIGHGVVDALRALVGRVGALVVVLGGTAALVGVLGAPLWGPLARALLVLGAWAGRGARTLGGLCLAGLAKILDWVRAWREEEGEEDWAGKVEVARPARAARVTSSSTPVRSPAPPAAAGRSAPAGPAADHSEDASGGESPPVVVLPARGGPRPPAREPLADVNAPDLVTDLAEPYEPPPLDLLTGDPEAEDPAAARDELLEQAGILEKTLRDFGIKGKVTQVQPGPVITRYEVEPAPGQKVAQIAGLSDDLALALRARQIRIVAPIPGKAAVGVEIPNSHPRVVYLRSLLQSPEFVENPSALNIALGRTIAGDVYCAPLDRMPHVLVAGATGAGKSVCINAVITSIVYRAGPDKVRFVMIDPKMLELSSYVGLPHLIPPVVSRPKEVVKILKWAVSEMEGRYRMLAHVGVRSIVDYNRRQEEEGAPELPYLVVIVDELADLMLSNVRGEIEEGVARLAQMARAVGIHLVLATQRPSVDVITGVIKANFPSRIAFQVPTRTDSRTILDGIGAERLLGRGDMLYLGVGMSEPVRIHGSFISTEETSAIVEWLRSRAPYETETEDEGPLAEANDLFPRERDDDLFDEAARILVAHQQGSISLLQRRLKVGYARAARLVDMMEEAGIVGPFTGSKAREILVPTLEKLDELLAAREGSSPGN